MKKSSVICCSEEELRAVSARIMLLAQGEGLDAHANAVGIRFGQEQK